MKRLSFVALFMLVAGLFVGVFLHASIGASEATAQGLVEYTLIAGQVDASGDVLLTTIGEPCAEVCNGVTTVDAIYNPFEETVELTYVFVGITDAISVVYLGQLALEEPSGELTKLKLHSKPLGAGLFDTTVKGTVIIHLDGELEFVYAAAFGLAPPGP